MKKLTFFLVAIATSALFSINAQTLLYSNDFESGLNGSTIVGNGVIEASGNAAHGQVFHNAAGGQATRSNYLTLPATLFADLKTSGTNALTISFWVNKGTADNYFWSPIFSAYAHSCLWRLRSGNERLRSSYPREIPVRRVWRCYVNYLNELFLIQRTGTPFS